MKATASPQNTTAQVPTMRDKPRLVERALRDQHQPDAEEQPDRIAPHGDRAAAAERGERQHRDHRPEHQPGDDAAVEGIGAGPRRRLSRGSARQEQRNGDEQRRQQEVQLAHGELQRMPQVVEQPARQHRAVFGIGERQEVVAHQPDEMRRHDHQRDGDRHIGPGRRPGPCARRGRRAGTPASAAPAPGRNTSPTARGRRRCRAAANR